MTFRRLLPLALLLALSWIACAREERGATARSLLSKHDDDSDASDQCHGEDCEDSGAGVDAGNTLDGGAFDAGMGDAGIADAGSGDSGIADSGALPACAPDDPCCADGGGDCMRFNPCVVPEPSPGCAEPAPGGGFVRGLDDNWHFQSDAGWRRIPLGSWSNFYIACGVPPNGCQGPHPRMCFAVPAPPGQVCNASQSGTGSDWATPEQADGGHDDHGDPDCDHQRPDELEQPEPGCWEQTANGLRHVPDGGWSRTTLVCGRPQQGCPAPAQPWCRLEGCRDGEICVAPSPFGVCNAMEADALKIGAPIDEDATRDGR